MTMTETRRRTIEPAELPRTREEAMRARLTMTATMGWLFKPYKPGSNLTRFDVLTPGEVCIQVETLNGLFYLSPSGTHVYCLRERTVKGVKGLKCVAWPLVDNVLMIEVK